MTGKPPKNLVLEAKSHTLSQLTKKIEVADLSDKIKFDMFSSCAPVVLHATLIS